MQQRQRRTRPAVPPYSNQRPRCKQRGIKLAALQSSGVFDPRGSRQISMQAWILGSLLAGIKSAASEISEAAFFYLTAPAGAFCIKSRTLYLYYR
jgi:hypothetical protein